MSTKREPEITKSIEVESKQVETISYLGPQGTFCESALMTQSDLSTYKSFPQKNIVDVFNKTFSGKTSLGIVPLENTIEGSVPVTLDMLIFESDLMIQREIDIDISLCLATIKNTKLKDIKTIYSHPHALAQCRDYLANKLPDVEIMPIESTAEAALYVYKQKDKSIAAICPEQALLKYSLTKLDKNIQDRSANQTRFIVVGEGIPKKTGHDKTSIVCFQRSNRPGSLLSILSEFAARNIDLSKLESRPTKEGLGQYCFLIDFIGHIGDDLVADCLQHVGANHADVKFLGSYAVAGDKGAVTRNSATKVWKETKNWIQTLRNSIED